MPSTPRRAAALTPLGVQAALEAHVAALARCARCPRMIGPVVAPPPIVSKVFLVGQAPGPREGAIGRPFAWTAGKTLFRWFGTLGVDEARFRAGAYIAAVCRCFPGKAASGGDRVPAPDEIAACSTWLERELELLQPDLLIPVGRLAISRFLGDAPLVEVIGQAHRWQGRDVIPLPHPSGASTWPKKEPGLSLTTQALARLARHPAWRAAFPKG